jgi:hypothetical protein
MFSTLCVKNPAQRRCRLRIDFFEQAIDTGVVQGLQSSCQDALNFSLREPGGKSAEKFCIILATTSCFFLHRSFGPSGGILSFGSRVQMRSPKKPSGQERRVQIMVKAGRVAN